MTTTIPARFKLSYVNFPRATLGCCAIYTQVETIRYYANGVISTYDVNFPMGCTWSLDSTILHVYRTTFNSNTNALLVDQITGLDVDFTFPFSTNTSSYNYTTNSNNALFQINYGTDDMLATTFAFDGSRFVWTGNNIYCLEIINTNVFIAKVNPDSVFQTFTLVAV